MRIRIFSGSRLGIDPDVFFPYVQELNLGDIIIHGSAKGLDSQVHEAGIKLGLDVISVPANWIGRGKSNAGHYRNNLMFETAAGLHYRYQAIRNYDYCVMDFVAFPIPLSKGTRDAIRLAEYYITEQDRIRVVECDYNGNKL
jgi:hypothetical protein